MGCQHGLPMLFVACAHLYIGMTLLRRACQGHIASRASLALLAQEPAGNICLQARVLVKLLPSAACHWNFGLPSRPQSFNAALCQPCAPVSRFRSSTGLPGWMGSVLLTLPGWYGVYCSGKLVPLPLPRYAGVVLLSLRTGTPGRLTMLRGESGFSG